MSSCLQRKMLEIKTSSLSKEIYLRKLAFCRNKVWTILCFLRLSSFINCDTFLQGISIATWIRCVVTLVLHIIKITVSYPQFTKSHKSYIHIIVKSLTRLEDVENRERFEGLKSSSSSSVKSNTGILDPSVETSKEESDWSCFSFPVKQWKSKDIKQMNFTERTCVKVMVMHVGKAH